MRLSTKFFSRRVQKPKKRLKERTLGNTYRHWMRTREESAKSLKAIHKGWSLLLTMQERMSH